MSTIVMPWCLITCVSQKGEWTFTDVSWTVIEHKGFPFNLLAYELQSHEFSWAITNLKQLEQIKYQATELIAGKIALNKGRRHPLSIEAAREACIEQSIEWLDEHHHMGGFCGEADICTIIVGESSDN